MVKISLSQVILEMAREKDLKSALLAPLLLEAKKNELV